MQHSFAASTTAAAGVGRSCMAPYMPRLHVPAVTAAMWMGKRPRWSRVRTAAGHSSSNLATTAGDAACSAAE